MTQRYLDYYRNASGTWTFMTVHHWGEAPQGQWTLKMAVLADSGRLYSWKLILYGTQTDPLPDIDVCSGTPCASGGNCTGNNYEYECVDVSATTTSNFSTTTAANFSSTTATTFSTSTVFTTVATVSSTTISTTAATSSSTNASTSAVNDSFTTAAIAGLVIASIALLGIVVALGVKMKICCAASVAQHVTGMGEPATN